MAVPRAFGFIPKMVNEGSAHQTPASLMIDTHYAQLGLVERWSWERFVRLCQFLRYTPWELASLVMIPHEAVEKFHRTSRIPGHNARAVALVLTLAEAHVMAKWTDDVIANPFPDLSRTPPPRPVRPNPFRKRTSPPSPAGCADSGGPHDAGAHTSSTEVSVGGNADSAGNAAADGDRTPRAAVAAEQAL